MPIYDYECSACGPFSAFRAMADFDKPAACDACGASAPRAILAAPALAMMDASARRGMAVNERSRHEPRRSGGHPSGCGCCGPSRRMATAAAGSAGRSAAKSFPGARPWMLSH